MHELTLITIVIHGPNIEIIIAICNRYTIDETFTFLPYKINLPATKRKHCTTALRISLCCNWQRNVVWWVQYVGRGPKWFRKVGTPNFKIFIPTPGILQRICCMILTYKNFKFPFLILCEKDWRRNEDCKEEYIVYTLVHTRVEYVTENVWSILINTAT
jgi:hypothetical protein